jgi:hypothetical protein
LVHTVETDDPNTVAYWPAAHGVHAVEPVRDAYWPETQALHAIPRPVAAENRPVVQPMQLAGSKAPVVVR